MKIDIQDGFTILANVIRTNSTHQDYNRTVQLAELLKRLVTGVGANELLKRFVPREDEKWFKQRELITQTITPAWSERMMSPFYKVPRVKPIKKTIDWDDGDTQERKAFVDEALLNFNGDLSLDDFLESFYVPMSVIDPNAWLITLFESFDYRTETPTTYASFIPSEYAIDFQYTNNTLDYLIVKLPHQYKCMDGKIQMGHRYQMYLYDEVIQFSQVDKEVGDRYQDGATFVLSGYDGTLQDYIRIDQERVFIIDYFEPKAGEVPAIRVGYKPDMTTDGRTYVNPFNSALPYFMKSIKAVSELDLSMAVHAFPQKIQYVPKCTGDPVSPELSCNNGYTTTGAICKVCKGTGVQAHTSAQDAITLSLPRDPDKAFDLTKLVHYVNVDTESVRFQNEYINSLEDKAVKAMFNSDIFVSDVVASTATEKQIDMQSVYDTVYPFGKKFSAVWRKQVSIVSAYLGVKENIIIEHAFPKDFKFKTEGDLMTELATATTSQAPSYIREDISSDLAELRYVDRPTELQRLRVKQMFDPFKGKTESQIIYIISNNLCRKYDKILWSAFTTIFTELEEEGLYSLNPYWFYDLSYSKQKLLVDAKVAQYTIAIDGEQPTAQPFSAFTQNTDNIGKIPLAIQQLSLAKVRAMESGDQQLSDSISNKIESLINKVGGEDVNMTQVMNGEMTTEALD
jgi:hypothetical protein